MLLVESVLISNANCQRDEGLTSKAHWCVATLIQFSIKYIIPCIHQMNNENTLFSLMLKLKSYENSENILQKNKADAGE